MDASCGPAPGSAFASVVGKAFSAGESLKPDMVNYFTHDLILHLVFFQAIIMLVILTNIRITHRARRHSPPPYFPMISILVPARDEEKNISDCIFSLLKQDYPSFELLVLDDQSNDRTRAILNEIAASHPELKVLAGAPAPGNQVGKNWACSQLAQQAQGELLFFTDADTFHKPETLRMIATALMGEKADLLTGYPRQEVLTLGERLLVPFFTWALFCFNPLELAYKFKLPVLSNAVGQLMLFRREAYQTIGGHDRVSSSIVDDLMLARQIKAAGLRWRVAYVADLISCRMYHESRGAWYGFAKNFFAAFDFHLLPYVFVFSWLAVMFLEPMVVFLLMLFGKAPQARAFDLAICCGLSVLIWLIPYLDMGIPFGLAFLYPFTILANIAVAFQSLQTCLFGQLSWKGRQISRPRWRWF
jgi:chlorobactene glucosyltransferase